MSIENVARDSHARFGLSQPVHASGGWMSEDTQSERIDAVFRNGSVTVVGVVTGFSLTFVTTWATNPVPWRLPDLFGIVPLAAGVVLQLVSLTALLHPDCLERPRYDRAINIFVAGLMFVAVGIAIVIAFDALKLAERV